MILHLYEVDRKKVVRIGIVMIVNNATRLRAAISSCSYVFRGMFLKDSRPLRNICTR